MSQLRLRRGWNYAFSLITIIALVSTGIMSGGLFQSMSAGNMDMLVNGGFEKGFVNQAGCGTVGSGWGCFTNGGAANFGFYDEQWSPVIAEGVHGQLIEINSKGFGQPDQSRMAGIYQTVQVVDWANYTFNLRGMLRTSFTGGDRDPWGYRVEVGWTAGKKADWNAVTNWQDVGWYNYYERSAPGSMQSYSTQIMAEDDYITVYIRALKKWGVPEEELDINLDAISLTGPALGYQGWQQPYQGGPENNWKSDGGWKSDGDWKHNNRPYDHNPPVTTAATCGGPELVYNGNFEAGFVPLAYGNVGKGWGNFTNGGAAGYGFYDEQWPPVISDGAHGQLIELNAKGVGTPDPDRYAGIWQQIKGLNPGQTYQLTLRGELRGAGNDADPDRFVAQWGWNADGDNDWSHVKTWTAMNLGMIYDRLNPGPMGTYTVQFQAPAKSVVLFIRGWKKWGITDVEMDFNLDSISLRACGGSAPPPPAPRPGKLCFYVVQPGDTLSSIADSFNVRLWDLAQVNGIANYDWIYVGQQLQIPGCYMGAPQDHQQGDWHQEPPPSHEPPPYHEPPPVEHRRTHTVAAGETLSYLCDLYGVDIWTIAQANGLTDLNFIYVGQVLVIP
ncbi:MAG: LysM peptidoglycan-binding domain-containing protein [Caldilineaceae bacterium]